MFFFRLTASEEVKPLIRNRIEEYLMTLLSMSSKMTMVQAKDLGALEAEAADFE